MANAIIDYQSSTKRLMFKKILIANRGEIALRIIHACRELGVKTVAVYSEADENSLHVRFADEDVCIGPARSSDSYLNVPAIISAAEITGADAIHPGYGFLSESAYLAEVCQACHIRFIGPDPSVIKLLGDKARARKAMKKAGVPMLPGSDGPVENEERALKAARDIGFPVIIKAVAGGGGRGMRVVRSADELPQLLRMATREAEAAFGNGDVYIEKYLDNPRHIEFQIIGDHHGNLVHLGERECSIQRRHQKLIEESPSPVLSEKVRRRMGSLVVDAAKAVQYTNAGTFEFLMDGEGKFYYMETNTRLQVEHPVTEMVTGIDIVKEQIRIAAGERLSFRQSDITFTGHSIECRINAEDPVTFAPSPGLIHAWSVPGGPGVRIDTFVHSECTISPYYDSMIAKIIVHGRDRQEAVARMRRTLEMTVIEGISTSVPLHLQILNDADFLAGRLGTGFMDRFMPAPKQNKLAETA
jgi:acetyl-CoA carboxylase, biotin carboxylase subunit